MTTPSPAGAPVATSKRVVPEPLIRSQVAHAVREVFKTMVHENVLPEAEGAEAPKSSEGQAVAVAPPRLETPHIVGMVGFVGAMNGFIYLYLDSQFAVHCTSAMLGMDPGELSTERDETVNDAVGELTNMVVGGFKNGLSDMGFPCKLTIPSILHAKAFSISSVKATRRFIYPFRCHNYRVIADVLMHEE